jgi:hypothetical protein
VSDLSAILITTRTKDNKMELYAVVEEFVGIDSIFSTEEKAVAYIAKMDSDSARYFRVSPITVDSK